MTRDQSPQLSGGITGISSLSGREPMITSPHTVMMVERRGAYITGNLTALLRHMTPDQRVILCRWNARVALRYARMASNHMAAEGLTLTFSNTLDALEMWLNNPTYRTMRTVGEQARELATHWSFHPNLGRRKFAFETLRVSLRYLTSWVPDIYDGHNIGVTSAAASMALSARRMLEGYRVTSRLSTSDGAVHRAQLRAAYIILERGG